jgi:hypothetical protein
MPKKFLIGILASILILSTLFSGCSATTVTLPIATTTIISTQTVIATTPLSTNPTTKSPTSIPTSINSPQYTANLIKIRDYAIQGAPECDAVLFFNNTKVYECLSCTIRQHNADGSFLSDYKVESGFIPPHTHLITILPVNTITGIPGILTGLIVGATANGISIYNIPNQTPINISFTNIYLKNMGNYTLLCGQLTSNSEIPPNVYISFSAQILTRSSDGSLTLVGTLSDHLENANYLPPQGEFMNYNIQLWDNQNVTIIDASKGIINGEINIVAHTCPK